MRKLSFYFLKEKEEARTNKTRKIIEKPLIYV